MDYGDGPMVRYPETGKYRRTRLFVMTLGYSRKSVRFIVWKSSTRIWAELHERAFRRLGGAPKVIVLDNLKEGVVEAEIHDPVLNPSSGTCSRTTASWRCRRGFATRIARARWRAASGTPRGRRSRGKRFESIEEAQAYLDRWEERWADTRIHGTTKRQVAAMFAEERPALTPLPVEPFRYYAFGTRTVHLDGFIEVEAAYYAPPPGYIGRELQAQWDGRVVRIIDPKTGQLLREHLRRERGRRAILPEDRPTPDAADHLGAARPSQPGRPEHRRPRRAHPPGQRRARPAPHPGAPLARPEARGAHRGRRLRRGARDGRAQLPVREALRGSGLAAAPRASPGRSPHPAAHRVPRRHPTHDQEP